MRLSAGLDREATLRGKALLLGRQWILFTIGLTMGLGLVCLAMAHLGSETSFDWREQIVGWLFCVGGATIGQLVYFAFYLRSRRRFGVRLHANNSVTDCWFAWTRILRSTRSVGSCTTQKGAGEDQSRANEHNSAFFSD